MKKAAVVGGGLVGLATARALGLRGWKVWVVEKESRLGAHQSSHNSGVLHCGLYYQPGSLKAKMAVEGIRSMTEYCARKQVPHEICGKLVVAADSDEVPRLDNLHQRGKANGLEGLVRLTASEAKNIEPAIRCQEALKVPQEGIVDYPAVAQCLADDIKSAGGQILLSSRLSSVVAKSQGWRVGFSAPAAKTDPGQERDSVQVDLLVNAGGLHCDRIARICGLTPETQIVPFRGQYWKLHPRWEGLVRNLIYPVPNPDLPFLGVHLTRMIRGGIEVGPNAFLAMGRESYRFLDVRLGDLAESISFPGLWQFMKRYPLVSLHELFLSLSRGVFARELCRLVPGIKPGDLSHGIAGIRAQAMRRDGTLIQDFDLVTQRGQLHVLNAPSPGATACLAIAEHLCDAAEKAMGDPG